MVDEVSQNFTVHRIPRLFPAVRSAFPSVLFPYLSPRVEATLRDPPQDRLVEARGCRAWCTRTCCACLSIDPEKFQGCQPCRAPGHVALRGTRSRLFDNDLRFLDNARNVRIPENMENSSGLELGAIRRAFMTHFGRRPSTAGGLRSMPTSPSPHAFSGVGSRKSSTEQHPDAEEAVRGLPVSNGSETFQQVVCSPQSKGLKICSCRSNR